jgi:hypothetical protein
MKNKAATVFELYGLEAEKVDVAGIDRQQNIARARGT